MTDILVPSPGGQIRLCYFREGTIWRPAIVDVAGHLQIDVLTSGLPAGGATAAAQALALAQLQLIEDMRDALQSVATDRLIVRGEDQLHSFAGVLATTNAAALLANDGYVESLPCPAGQIWHVTNIWAADFTTATTRGTINLRHDGVEYPFHANPHARGISEPYSWHGHLWLDPSDTGRFYFIGGIIGDSCSIRLTGEIMTLET